jgi:hypothetical protein
MAHITLARRCIVFPEGWDSPCEEQGTIISDDGEHLTVNVPVPHGDGMKEQKSIYLKSEIFEAHEPERLVDRIESDISRLREKAMKIMYDIDNFEIWKNQIAHGNWTTGA